MTIKIVSMTTLRAATERAGPRPAVCAGGEGRQVEQCLLPSTDGKGYSRTAFLLQHLLAAEKGITHFSSLPVTFVHKATYSIPSSSLMKNLSL